MKQYLDLMRHVLDHGVKKYGQRAGAGAVVFFGAMVEYMAHQVEVLLHRVWLIVRLIVRLIVCLQVRSIVGLGARW